MRAVHGITEAIYGVRSNRKFEKSCVTVFSVFLSLHLKGPKPHEIRDLNNTLAHPRMTDEEYGTLVEFSRGEKIEAFGGKHVSLPL
jgi:hypothetical protein